MNRLDLGMSLYKNFSVGLKPLENISYIRRPLKMDTVEIKSLKGKFQQFVSQDGNVDDSLEKYLTRILNNDGVDNKCLLKFITPFLDTSMTSKTKRVILRFFKDLELSTPLRNYDHWSGLAQVIRKQIDDCTTEDEMISQIRKIKSLVLQAKTSDEADSIIENFSKIPRILFNKGFFSNIQEAENWAKKLNSSGIVPTNGIVKALNDDMGAAMSMLSLLANSKFRILDIDNHALTKILNNSSSNIRKVVLKALGDSKDRAVMMKEDRFNSSQYLVAIDKEVFIFDKSSEKLISSCSGSFSEMQIQNCILDTSTHARYNISDGYGDLLDKEVTDNLGQKTYFAQASVEGQLDALKVDKDNYEILSRAVTDPCTGEFVVKQNLESPAGIKIKSHFLQQPNGDNVYNYSIQSLLDLRRTYKILDENNFVSTINGQVYHINVFENLLNVTTNGITETIDLKALVPSGDEKIIDMIKHLPGDEIIKINTSGLKEVSPYMGNPEVSGQIDGIIKLGEKHKDNQFIFLHELGHHKASAIEDEDWNRILAVYHKELNAYKAKTTSHELHMIDHIIENSDHYLNRKHGAIEEIFSDTNALLSLPNTERGIAERILVLQEMFPETMAEIAKYL